MDTQPPVNAGGIKKHDEPSAAAPVTVAKDDGTAKVPGDSGVAASSAPAPAVEQEKDQDLKQKTPVEVGDDEDSDFDELDEVLDDFSKPARAPTAPAKPDTTASQPPSAEDFDESAFMKQLEQDMANMMSQAANETGATDGKGFESAIDPGAEAFAKKLEESGIEPGEFLKQLLNDVMAESGGTAPAPDSAAAATKGDAAASPDTFNDAIQRTINRMKESGDKATAAATEDDLSDDLLAQLLKAVEAGENSEGDLTKLISGMMEQLSNKEMLYEPMKELDTKFGPWISANKDKVSADEMSRYATQAKYVSEIVAKFEEPGYTDEDPKCREYVWERMQAMQAAGSPPEELVANPWNPLLDDALSGGSAGGMPDCPQQ
ncbi:Peroxisome chaperone and import receptor [Monascus purpureus]|uniref:Peroxisome chaperone and import receptor n=1 Tax=Monascus purpureus TaxID=5098 RepID=A0A507QK26_MONPU|nr:Peroxisome chaperone and import receptor [Monascus purpureus]BDD57023.1 hypothetical protein MAP00_002430 [Monascus purpureus]